MNGIKISKVSEQNVSIESKREREKKRREGEGLENKQLKPFTIVSMC